MDKEKYYQKTKKIICILMSMRSILSFKEIFWISVCATYLHFNSFH